MINGTQIRAARAWLGMSQETLAEMAEVSKRTVMRIEMGREEPVFARTLKAIQAALEKEGIKFIFENGVGVGVRVQLETGDTQLAPSLSEQKKETAPSRLENGENCECRNSWFIE